MILKTQQSNTVGRDSSLVERRPVDVCLDLMDMLRRQRAKEGWTPESDKALLDALKQSRNRATLLQRQWLDMLTWRVWPDQFRKQGRDRMVAYLTNSSRWRMGRAHNGPCWHHIGKPIVMFYDELGDDAGERVMEVES